MPDWEALRIVKTPDSAHRDDISEMGKIRGPREVLRAKSGSAYVFRNADRHQTNICRRIYALARTCCEKESGQLHSKICHGMAMSIAGWPLATRWRNREKNERNPTSMQELPHLVDSKIEQIGHY
jgi:hypothetical protein